IDESLRLLGPELERALGAVSVFRGGATREAIEAVCGEELASLETLAALRESGLVALEGTRYRVLACIREAALARVARAELASLAREVGDRSLEANVLGNLAYTALVASDYDAALDLGGRCLALHRELGNAGACAMALRMVGATLASRGETDLALSRLEEARSIALEKGFDGEVAQVLYHRGALRRG